MSAFVVQDKTINRIINLIATDYRGNFDYALKKVSGAVGFAVGRRATDDEWDSKLGREMFALNCRAVDARYGEGQASEFRPLDYAWHSEPCTMMQAYKALGCWHYQCSEGDIPDEELYKAFEDLYNAVAHTIVSATREYEAVGWDAD